MQIYKDNQIFSSKKYKKITLKIIYLLKIFKKTLNFYITKLIQKKKSLQT